MNINGFKTKISALNAIRDAGFKVSGLLTAPESNPKVAKNGKVGVMTAPLHLAPASLSGFNVCAQASNGCIAACLHTAGNPVHMPQKTLSRIAKTKAYFHARKAFVALLAFEIAALERKAERAGLQAGIRLNATSDISWEGVALECDGVKVSNLMMLFPAIEFYDYTKITKRALKSASGKLPPNYSLTFSKTENNDADVARVIEAGGNVAIVFHKTAYKLAIDAGVYHGAAFEPWKGIRTIDGDEHDFRPVDPKGVIVALKAKGDAKSDTSGFVVY